MTPSTVPSPQQQPLWDRLVLDQTHYEKKLPNINAMTQL